MSTTETRTDSPVGITLDNGAEVVEYHQQYEAGNGWNRHGIALCKRDHPYHPWVTWTLYQDWDGEWHAEAGVYHESVVDAVTCYQERSNR